MRVNKRRIILNTIVGVFIISSCYTIYKNNQMIKSYKNELNVQQKLIDKQNYQIKKNQNTIKEAEKAEKEYKEKLKEFNKELKEMGYDQLQNYTPTQINEVLKKYDYVKLPRKYKLLIINNTKKYNIDTSIMFAMYRQESGYDFNNISETDCIGIGQLALATAQEFGYKIGYTSISRGDLFNPEKNINITTNYFGYLLKIYNGSYYKALRAYNGNSDPNYYNNVMRYVGKE